MHFLWADEQPLNCKSNSEINKSQSSFLLNFNASLMRIMLNQRLVFHGFNVSIKAQA